LDPSLDGAIGEHLMEKRPALGKGLSALIPEEPVSRGPMSVEVDIDRLVPNEFQPRLAADEPHLTDLTQSIAAHGVIQPIVVRPIGDRFQIIAGERRWRAATRAGLRQVPVVVRNVAPGSERSLLEMALVENIQRENLNPIDEALAYRRLADDFQLTQESIAAAVGKDRGTEAEILRVARDVVARNLSVRETESAVKKIVDAVAPKAPVKPQRLDVHTRAAEDRLKLVLGTRVRIVRRGTRGRIEIEFASEDELIRIYEHLTEKSG
jgi:ParB family chromosome partitioning protein